MADCSSFSDLLRQDSFQHVAAMFYEKHFAVGEMLFDYNDPANTFYFLVNGRLSVQKSTGFKERMQVVALLDAGAVVSEASLIPGHTHRTRVTAIEGCTLLCLDREKFVQFRNDDSTTAAIFLECLLCVVALRLEKSSERLAHIL